MNEEENIESSPQDGQIESQEEEVNEIISQEQTIEEVEIQNQTSDINTSEITSMEVHHHPHVEKKNFKEYFLEFLMIFLAVTMGFIAENIRENISEHEIAKDMAYNLYQEVRADSIAVRQKIAFREKKIEQMSYFIAYVKDSSLTTPSRKFILRRMK